MLIIVGLPLAVYAQTATDAGALLQQVEQERQKVLQRQEFPSPQAESVFEVEPIKDELRIIVKSFHFKGNTLFSEKKLATIVRQYLNHPVSYSRLEGAAAAVGEYYRKWGWTVRSFLPKQDIVDGVVTIQIVEAKFGKVRIEEGSYRWPVQKKIESMVANQQKEGKSLNARKLERVLLILDDLPGVAASGRLQQGERDSETDLVVKQEKEPMISGALLMDNEGSRSTGYYRVHDFTQLMNLFSIGDQSSVYLLYSEGLRFVRFEETIPIGNSGLRIGVNASVIRYEVLPSEFQALDSKGSSNSIGAQAVYPLIRTRQRNLYFNFNYDHKNFSNYNLDAISSRYRVDNYTASFRGNMIDQFGGGGNTYVSFGTVLGVLDVGAPHSGEDATLDGRFQKMTYSIARQQTIIPKVSLYNAISGQISPNAKLDSSEKLYLGGPNGVRAYPVSEGSGVEGHLVTTQLRWKFAPQFQLSGFYDHGRVVNYGGLKSYSLKGAGIELAWQSKSGFGIKATWARRIGGNPNATSTGNDQDGSYMKDRFWLSMIFQF